METNSSTTTSITQARKNLGLTQLQLADKAGISQSFLSFMENGLQLKRSGAKTAVAEALGLSAVDLFPTTKESDPEGGE